MANVAFTCSNKIWEQTAGKWENKVHSLRCSARSLRLWRRAGMALAKWDSRTLRRERLAGLNDHLLADIGLTRETQIVDLSKLFCWLP